VTRSAAPGVPVGENVGEDGADRPAWLDPAVERLEAELVAEYGEARWAAAKRGLGQVARFWRPGDGDADRFASFVRTNFGGTQAQVDEMFARFERLFEQLDGHLNEIVLALRRQTDLDVGPIAPFDRVFAAYDPGAHLADDFFENKLAFVVLLNFPLTTLETRLTEGASWSRRQWAETRLAERFGTRVPAAATQAVGEATAAAEQYIAGYNIWMHHLVGDAGAADGERLFPPGLRLLSHWNLRDEIKAQYSDPDGLPRQRLIQQVMDRIVTQTIPAVVVDNPHVDWDPVSNRVTPAAVADTDSPPPSDLVVVDDREPDTRYERLLATFRAATLVDPHSPAAPTLIARRFDESREIPEARVRRMFEEVLTSPLLGRIAVVIESRLGRPLEPFDIWYNGFRPRGAYTEAELDRIVSARYPTAAAYQEDIPNLLGQLGFAPDRAASLAENILVEPARGSGHAWGGAMRSARTHLRTRVESTGMNYKGFNIAVHEMGHNVEQTFSLERVDHTLLRSVPNTAFTEALAFVFQARDLELLGLSAPTAENRALETLDSFWSTCEIAAVALVDMAVWHWMYDHPDATAAELREATLGVARDVWNRYFAAVIGTRDVVLLGVYSHMIDSMLYLPDYPIGYMIASQIEEQMARAGAIGPEFERMTTFGSLAPDLWMENATGAPVGPAALIASTERALAAIGEAADGP
jgi:hypothetical protein